MKECHIYPPAWNSQKGKQNVQNNGFLDFGRCTAKEWFLRDEKQMRWALWLLWLATWREFSSCKAGRGNSGRVRWSPWIERVWGGQGSWCLQGRILERRELKGERNSWDLQRLPLKYSEVRTDQCIHVRKLPKARKRITWKD